MGITTQATATEQRRVVARHRELDSRPSQLRSNLAALEDLVRGSDYQTRRRVRLMFGALVANWQVRYSGEPISASAELLAGGAVRICLGNPGRMLSHREWTSLVSPAVSDLVDDWGVDRRASRRAWFEFRPSAAAHPESGKGQGSLSGSR